MLRQRNELHLAQCDPQTGRPFDLHDQLISVRNAGAHFAAVNRHVGDRGLRAFAQPGVDFIDRGEQHGLEFVERVSLPFLQGIGEAECGYARDVRAGHRGSLHVAVIRSVARFGAKRRKDAGFLPTAQTARFAAGSRDITAGTVVGIIGRQVVGRERGDGDIITIACRIAGHGCRFVAGGKNDQSAVEGLAVLLGGEVLKRLVIHRRLFDEHVVRRVYSRLDAPRALEDGGTVIRGVFYGTARHEGVTRQVSREDLTRHETHTVSLARTSGHAADADAVVIDGGYRARNVRSVSRIALLTP